MIDLKFIKVLNPDKANELAQYGFKYTKETFEGKTLYVFPISEEIVKHMQKSFSSKDFFIDKTMNF